MQDLLALDRAQCAFCGNFQKVKIRSRLILCMHFFRLSEEIEIKKTDNGSGFGVLDFIMKILSDHEIDHVTGS